MFRIPVLLSLAFAASLLVTPASAVEPDEVLKDPALEERARVISRDLRCLVCQNQSIDDSDAPLAKDLRVLVRERLQKGESNSQVIDFVVSRYGEFVLLKPRFADPYADPLARGTRHPAARRLCDVPVLQASYG